MSLARFKSSNHPQQVGVRGARDDVDDRGTDPALFDELNARFNFSIDVAAAPHNAKCERYYDRSIDGLAESWAGERVWCNPPYSDIESWVAKAWDESRAAECIVMLLPANRTEQGWWHRRVEPFRNEGAASGLFLIEFLEGRRRFVMPGNTEIQPNERPPFGVCLLIWQYAKDLARREGGHSTDPPGDTPQVPSTKDATAMVGLR